MSKKSLSNAEFIFRESNPQQFLKFIDFLQKEGNEEDYIETVLNFISSSQTTENLDFENVNLIKRLIQHCLTAASKLFCQNQEANALELLESARNIISQVSNRDQALDKLKTVLYNNIAVYCMSIDDHTMAIRFLQNCLKKDTGASPTLTCIFYNNIAGIYLTHAKYEKAFTYTKKALYLLEPEIFSVIKENPSKKLREDVLFRKNLMVLLVGYLNMGSILEGYHFRTSALERSREMLDMNPKDFYKNSFGLAKKFLGESHSLTNRLSFCYTKNEFLLFKEVASTGDSDIERNKTPKRRLKNMLDSIDDEDNLPGKHFKNFKVRGYSPKSQSSKSLLIKPSYIRKNSLSKTKPLNRQSADSSAHSHNNSYEENTEEPFKPPRFSGSEYRNYVSKIIPRHEGSYNGPYIRSQSNGAIKQPISSFAQQASFPGTPDQTQILLQVMFHQQRDLEEKLNKKFDEIKSTKVNQAAEPVVESKTSETKEDFKIKLLEKEIEHLKEKMFEMKQEKQNYEETIKAKLIQQQQHQQPVINMPLVNEFSPQPKSNQNYEKKQQSSLKTISTVDTSAMPGGKETESSTKSSGAEFNHFYLSPQRSTQPPSGYRPDKNSFENNSGLPIFEPLSPIYRDEKDEQDPQSNSKEPNWIPGKYADPKSRKFQLDLAKVNGSNTGAEELRARGKPEEEPSNNNNNNSINIKPNLTPTPEVKSIPKLKDLRQPEKVPLKKTQDEKETTTTIGSISAVTKTAPKEDEVPPKNIVPSFPRKGSIGSTTGQIPDKTEKDNSSMSIKLQEADRTPKDDQSIFNDRSDKKAMDDDDKTAGDDEIKLVRSDTEQSKSFTGYKRNSISIPTSIDYMDSLHGGQINQPGHVKTPKYAVVRKRVSLDDDTHYIIACRASWTKEEKIFKLQLMALDEKTGVEHSKVESELELPYKDLRAILKHVEYKDVMPVTFHIKQIKNFYTLVRFLLMPFTTVRIQEDGKKEIAIYPKPPNLLTNSLNDMPTIDFMGQQCVIIFTHVIRNTFRIVLTHPENVEEVLRIDVEFDQTSLDHCFKKNSGKDAPLRAVETSLKIINGYDDDADDDEFNDCKEAAKKLTSSDRVDDEEMETYKVINKDLAEDIANILKEMEEFFNSIGIEKMNQLADEKEVKYCKLKVNNKMKKPTLLFVWDHPDRQNLDVTIQNLYETFAPDKKVKACGKAKYQYDSVWKHFGLSYAQLDPVDKVTICSYISELYNIDVFDKELSKEDVDRYEENPISFLPIEIGSHHRIFLGEKYKFPLTLSLVGIRGEPKGIKATIYNLEEAMEVGAFFHINPLSWLVPEGEKKKKRSYKVNPDLLIENYHLDYILKKCGWEILISWLVLDRRPNKTDIVGIRIFKEIRCMEQIENVLNSDTVLKHFSEKDEVEA